MWTLILVVSCLSCSVIGQLQWRLITEGTTGGPPARRDASIGYDEVSSKVILFGGRGDDNTVFGDTWIYEIIPRRWTKLNITGPGARFSFVSGVKDSKFYIATGQGLNKFFFDDIWKFDIQKETWEELPAQHQPFYYTDQRWKQLKREQLKPEYRYGAAGGIFKDSSSARFYLSMGFSRRRFSDTYSYSFSEQGWFRDYPDQSPYSPAYPHARCLHAGTMISRDELLIFGGCLSGGGTGGPCPSSDSWIFNGKTKQWKQLKNCAAARIYSTLAMLPIKSEERRAILFGGQVNSSQVIYTVEPSADQIGVFNPYLEEWTLRRTVGKIPSRRASVAMATGRTGVYMFGGLDLETAKVSDQFYELVGDSSMADKAPLSADCSPTFFSQIMLHGILMVLAWGFFLPWGAFIARHMKHREPLWFHLHRLFQVTGLLLAIAGVICAILSVQFDHVTFVHAIIGTIVMIIGIQQPMNAIIRCPKPDEGERKTLRRAVWEFTHRLLGHGAVYLGLANICLGLFLALAHQIIWIVWFAYLGFLLVTHVIAEVIRQYRCSHGGLEENLKMSTINKYVINDACENAYEDR